MSFGITIRSFGGIWDIVDDLSPELGGDLDGKEYDLLNIDNLTFNDGDVNFTNLVKDYDYVFKGLTDDTGSVEDYYYFGDSYNGTVAPSSVGGMIGQSFTNTRSGSVLTQAKFYLSRGGSLTGTIYARLYAHSGTFGTSSVPTGSVLATSDGIDVSTLDTIRREVVFTFSTPYALSANTKYCIEFDFLYVDESAYLQAKVGYSFGQAGFAPYQHDGNFYRRNSEGTPSADATNDIAFKIIVSVADSELEISRLNVSGGQLEGIIKAEKGVLMNAVEGDDYAKVPAGVGILRQANGVISFATVGTHYQGADALLTAIAGLTTAQGDLVYATGVDTVSVLNKDENATRYLSNTGTTNNPAWAQIALTTGVSGVLPVANGGTGVANGSNNTITLTGNYTLGLTLSNNTSVTLPTTGTVATLASSETLTNKRITKRPVSIASSATPTPDGDATDLYIITALTAGATFGAPTGTPTQGQSLVIRILDNGTARALAWNAIYRASSDLALPTTTVLSKTMYLEFIYNVEATKWDLLSYLNNF